VIRDRCGNVSNRATIKLNYNQSGTSESCEAITDGGSTLGRLSMLLLIMLTVFVGLFYVRREEERNKIDF
jgi:hypothetical protein